MKKNRILQIIFFLIFVNGYSQKITYSFRDTLSINKASIEITIDKIKPNIVKYIGLFNYKNFETTTFKIIDEHWYIKINKQWHLFFYKGQRIPLVFNTGKFKFSVSWMKANFKKINNQDIYEFKLNPINFTMSGNTKYYFTYKDGFFAIKGHDGFFVREDLIPDLTDLQSVSR